MAQFAVLSVDAIPPEAAGLIEVGITRRAAQVDRNDGATVRRLQVRAVLVGVAVGALLVANIERRGVVRVEAVSRDRHDHDLEVLHEPHQRALLDLVGELSRGGREDHVGRDKDGADHEAHAPRIEPSPLGRAIRREQREGELEDVVVHRAQELRPEERREAALPEQGVLVVSGHSARMLH